MSNCQVNISSSKRIEASVNCILVILSTFVGLVHDGNGGAILYNNTIGNFSVIDTLFSLNHASGTFFGGGLLSTAKNNSIARCCFHGCSATRGGAFRINPADNSSIMVSFSTAVFCLSTSQDVVDLWKGYHYINNINSSMNTGNNDGAGFQVLGSKDSIIQYCSVDGSIGGGAITFWDPGNSNNKVEMINLINNTCTDLIQIRFSWTLTKFVFYKNAGNYVIHLYNQYPVTMVNCYSDLAIISQTLLTLSKCSIMQNPVLNTMALFFSAECKNVIGVPTFDYHSSRLRKLFPVMIFMA